MPAPNISATNTITLANQPLTYHVIYQKNRKTIQLKIISSTHLQITAPNKFPLASIEELLHKKSSWIIKKILHLADTAVNPLNKAITDGASILYLGQPHTLVFTTTQSPTPTIKIQNHNQITLSIYPLNNPTQTASLASSTFKKWYIKNAHALLQEKTLLWSNRINVHPERITIKEQKTRWGSCSSKGNINYNWRIIMAPPEVIDYLVIHELCHLRVPNHSTLFWQEVAKFSPNFKMHRAWLRTNGTLLMNILNNN